MLQDVSGSDSLLKIITALCTENILLRTTEMPVFSSQALAYIPKVTAGFN